MVSDELEKNEEDASPEAAEAAAANEDAFDYGEDEDAAGELAQLQSELAELKDSLLRQRAETENVRRRGEREKQDAAAYAVTSFARDILTVADNLRRVLEAVPEELKESGKVFIEGVELTERELLATLERYGIERIDPEVGEAFDPAQHQAMFEVPTNDQPGGTISQVVGAGFMIKGRLLRPAMVGVAKNGDEKPKSVDTEA